MVTDFIGLDIGKTACEKVKKFGVCSTNLNKLGFSAYIVILLLFLTHTNRGRELCCFLFEEMSTNSI